MAKSSKLTVMLSSRCNDHFPNGAATTFSDIRRELKAEIEQMEIAGRTAFEVWINEDAPPAGASQDSWEVCIDAVKKSDILIVISNGNAGWAAKPGDIGICHAEMMTGLSIAPAKLRLIAVDNIAITNDEAGARNQRFQNELSTHSLFRGANVTTLQNLKTRVKEALHDSVITLAQAGVRDAAKGKFHSGAALDWSRLDFRQRREEMTGVLRTSIQARKGTLEESKILFVQIDGQKLLVQVDAIPAALTVGAARELVGQPFLRDYQHAALLTGKRGGPIHIIACQKTATESQASKLLGFPDATLVTAPFGVFVADPIQKVQFVFITNCRDESNTRHGFQRFMEWLDQTGEGSLVAKRAIGRARIVRAIAKEA